MTVQSTSLAAYAAIQEHLSVSRGKVFAALWGQPEPICDHQIATLLHWPHHCVTPRRGELVQMGLVESAFIKEGPPNGLEVHFWQVRHEAVEGGFFSPLKCDKTTRDRQRISVSQAARILADHRKTLRKIRLQNAASAPLFEGV
jgi:hypothetical protein